MTKFYPFVVIFSFALLLIGFIGLGQENGSEKWIARYNGSANSIDIARAIAVSASGNVYVTGWSKAKKTDFDYATVAYNSSGKQIWTARYNGPADSKDRAYAIAVSESEIVYVTGCSEGSGSYYDYATIAYDSLGNQLWISRYDGPGNFYDCPQAIALSASGNVCVTGWSEGSGTNYDYATVVYDGFGNQLWVARYDGPARMRDYAHAIASDSFGNVYVTGGSYGGATYFDYATVAYDSAGNLLWVARYDGPANLRDYGCDLACGSLGNIYVTGWSKGNGTNYDYATVAYDSTGDQLWASRYNAPADFHDYAQAIAVNSVGNVFVTGRSEGRRTSYDYATVAYDSYGNQIWASRYNGPANFRDYAGAIAIDSSGNVYVTGGSGSFVNETSYDYATVAYDSSGNQLWVSRYNGPANADDLAKAITIDSKGAVYVTGWIHNSGYSDFATLKYYSPLHQVQINNHTDGNIVGTNLQKQMSSNALIDQIFYANEIERTNLEIESQGLKWKAGGTSLSPVVFGKRSLMIEGDFSLKEESEKYVKVGNRPNLPSSLDWRSKNGGNYMTSVKRIVGCASCWAFAVIGTMEAMYNVESGMSDTRQCLQFPNFSEQELISCSNAGDCSGGPRWNLGLCAEYIKCNGIVNEECFQYGRKDIPCMKCPEWRAKLAFVLDWGWVTQGIEDRDRIIAALQDGPLSFWMEVYDDFYSYEEGIYEPTVSAEPTGPHKVVLVGYNENESYWICKNSWGDNWGEDGYFRIKMGVCGTGKWVMKLWGISINDSRPVFLGEIEDRTVIEGKEISIQLSADDPDGDQLTFCCSPLPEGACVENGVFLWTPDYTQSGEYEIRLSVNDGQLEDFKYMKITVLDSKKSMKIRR